MLKSPNKQLNFKNDLSSFIVDINDEEPKIKIFGLCILQLIKAILLIKNIK